MVHYLKNVIHGFPLDHRFTDWQPPHPIQPVPSSLWIPFVCILVIARFLHFLSVLAPVDLVFHVPVGLKFQWKIMEIPLTTERPAARYSHVNFREMVSPVVLRFDASCSRFDDARRMRYP